MVRRFLAVCPSPAAVRTPPPSTTETARTNSSTGAADSNAGSCRRRGCLRPVYTNSKTGQVSDYCGLSCLNVDDPVLGESIDQRRSAAKVEPTEGRRIQILVINECGNILTYVPPVEPGAVRRRELPGGVVTAGGNDRDEAVLMLQKQVALRVKPTQLFSQGLKTIAHRDLQSSSIEFLDSLIFRS